ncbi:MAG: hypothetical protein H7099_13265 [Gemmatimonadaceae bacterium]|nr:hypothetical protein [Gemmatimonadaceae bacterium]
MRAIAAALLMCACTPEVAVKPVVPAFVPVAQFAPMAFIADVDVRTGRIAVTAPEMAGPGVPTFSLEGPIKPSLSLLGAEAVRLLPTNYHASEVGAYAPNKIRVSFDVTIENKLPYVALTTPTWPQPPAAGVILFPLDYEITTTPGDVNGGDGNGVVVTVPNTGQIVPSIDWNGTGTSGSGSPYSFFNDIGCTEATSNECFRWETFGLSIAPGTTSSTRTVGFDIDASVAQFRTRMIVAADLQPATLLAPARISGSVTSPTAGSLSGVRVTATTGQSALTDAAGLFVLSGFTPGVVRLSLSGLPPACDAPDEQSVSLAAGDSAVSDFVVACDQPTGMLTGTLTSSNGGTPLAGATVVASTGGSAVTSASGTYMIVAAGAGAGSVSVSAMPTECRLEPVAYTLQTGGAVTLDLVATCLPPVGPGN